jgi:hypothetical protein
MLFIHVLMKYTDLIYTYKSQILLTDHYFSNLLNIFINLKFEIMVPLIL